MRKIRLKWNLDQPPTPERFMDFLSLAYPAIWRGEGVRIGLSFFSSGALTAPDLESMSLTVRQDQLAEGSHFYVQSREGGIDALTSAQFSAGNDHVELTIGPEISAGWSCRSKSKRALWMVINATMVDESRYFLAGYLNLHESATGIGGGNDAGETVAVAPVGLIDRIKTIDATATAVTVTLPGPAVRQQAAITNGGGQLDVDGEMLPEGVSLDREFTGAAATYSAVDVIFPMGSIGVVSYAALYDLGPIVID